MVAEVCHRSSIWDWPMDWVLINHNFMSIFGKQSPKLRGFVSLFSLLDGLVKSPFCPVLSFLPRTAYGMSCGGNPRILGMHGQRFDH